MLPTKSKPQIVSHALLRPPRAWYIVMPDTRTGRRYQVNLAMAEIAESEEDDDNPLEDDVFMAPLSSDDEDEEHGWAEGSPQPMPSPPAAGDHLLSGGGGVRF